jgi:hypothetical protein
LHNGVLFHHVPDEEKKKSFTTEKAFVSNEIVEDTNVFEGEKLFKFSGAF